MSNFSHTLGKYRATDPLLNDGDTSEGRINQNGIFLNDLGTRIAGEDLTNDVLKSRYSGSPTHISTATTTFVKVGAGHIHTINVQGGTAGTIIGYDNTVASGTVLFSYDSTNALATYTLDVIFGTGLTIVTSAATKLTVSWS